MKKFLTVLLALSVVFTYTVGTAFAATGTGTTEPTDPTAKLDLAKQNVITSLTSAANEAKKDLAKEYKEIAIANFCVIDKAVYEKTIDKVVEDLKTVINIASEKVADDLRDGKIYIPISGDTIENPDAYAIETAIRSTKVDLGKEAGMTYANYLLGSNSYEALFTGSNFINKDLATFVTASPDKNTKGYQKRYIAYAWANASTDMAKDFDAAISMIDMSVYTDDAMPAPNADKTYAQMAADRKADLEKIVAETSVNATMEVETIAADLNKVFKKFWQELEKYDVIPAKDTLDGVEVVLSYKFKNLATRDDLEKENANDEAKKANLIAQIKANVAGSYEYWLTWYNNTDKTAADKAQFDHAKDLINAYEEVNTVLVNEGIVKEAAGFVDYDNALTRAGYYEAAADFASVLKLQVEKDGSLKYVADKVDKILAELKVKIYNGKTIKVTDADFADAKNVASNLAWEKEVLVALINAEKEAVLAKAPGFYAPEAEKVEAKYQELVDKVNAAETKDALDKVAKKTVKPFIKVLGVANITTVNTDVEKLYNTGIFAQKVNDYINYLNTGTNGSYDNNYRANVTVKDVAEYLAGEGARTNADVAAYFDKAEDYAKAVQTRGEKNEAVAAVEALIDALPAHITLADKDAVQAAWEAADAIGYAGTKVATLNRSVAIVQAAEEKAIDDMIAALPKTLTAADKAAVDAIYDAIDAFNAEEMYTADYAKAKADKVDDAFVAVRAAALRDVENAIAGLSANPTKAEVEAVRAVVEAFVAEYTDAADDYQAIAKITNLDKLTYAEAVVKANAIKSVEALKVVKNHSVAGKGYIKIAWSTKGDDSAVKGYQIYRATKANGKYTKFFTTSKKTYKNTKSLKKGTKYFYKVRAYAEIDGVKYYSDWSNKAYRVAK